MYLRKTFLTTAISSAIVLAFSNPAYAVGGASGPVVHYASQGKIGVVQMNPYKIAPLTAVIRNGGYVLSDISVRIVPKENGQEIAYKVSDGRARTHGGIPVFGLYPGYQNTVEVSYTRTVNGSSEKIEKEIYKIYAAPANVQIPASVTSVFPEAEVIKVDPEFSDRLYLVNNMTGGVPPLSQVVWNNPMGGALEWTYFPSVMVYDTKGEIRWYLEPSSIFDVESIYRTGLMLGFRQNEDGAFSWGYGQRYVKYDLMGREIFNRRLPLGYADFSHALHPTKKGTYLIRVSAADHLRADGKRVHTIRDVIVEVDKDGNVVDDWRLFDILDPYRDVVLKVIDQGAVCLNIDPDKAGQTLSEDELAALDSSDQFGDIVGAGPGRNWAHVNSVYLDPSDDALVISSRHQSAVIKIGRDKKVKWIMGSPEGWKGDFLTKVLTPVDSKGKPIKCENSKCEGDFDWTWTQHTGWRIDSKSDDRFFYLSAFDNGDSRGMEQPPMPTMKYSRAVIYKIDQEKMTVEQIWEYGKERGNSWYSPVTSLTEYWPDKDSIVVYSATAGSEVDMKTGAMKSPPNPYIDEFKWGAKEPSVEIQLKNCSGYQAMPIDLGKAFNQ